MKKQREIIEAMNIPEERKQTTKYFRSEVVPGREEN